MTLEDRIWGESLSMQCYVVNNLRSVYIVEEHVAVSLFYILGEQLIVPLTAIHLYFSSQDSTLDVRFSYAGFRLH